MHQPMQGAHRQRQDSREGNMELVSISEVAEELGWSYHRTRNNIRRNPLASQLVRKVGNLVVLDRKVVEVLRDTSK